MWHEALSRHLSPDDEAFGEVLGILSGIATIEFVDIGKVEIKLTEDERAELLSAIIKSQRSLFRFPIASFLSADLEELLCGYKPERYKVIVSNIDIGAFGGIL